MGVYIDALVNHGKRIGRAGPYWCHLVADDETELHQFAEEIGLKREWFQAHSFPHYDIGTFRKYKAALMNGATPVSRRELVEVIRNFRRGAE